MDLVSQYFDLIPARGRLIARHVTQSALLSILVGSVGGWIGANLFPLALGPFLPYVVCSSIGFCASSYQFWKTEKDKALTWYKQYPTLMQHHLYSAFPGVPFPIDFTNTEKTPSSFSDVAWLVMAAQNATTDIEEIQTRKASQIIDSFTETNGKEE